MKLTEILQSIPSQEGLKIVYDGVTYNRPYQNFFYEGQEIKGLREMKDRFALLKGISEETPAKKYLDVGCNMGYFVRRFSESFEEVNGVDYDAFYNSFAKMVYPQLSNVFKLADLNASRLTSMFSVDSFDFITSLSMIEYIDNKQVFLSDLFSLLKQGGICVIEGHSMDINLGHDETYEKLIRQQPWKVERLSVRTDNGLNAPHNAMGRPVWLCRK